MKFKKVMLATFLLLAILTIGAVSAADEAISDDCLEIDDNDIVEVVDEDSESDLSNGDGESVLEAKSYVEVDVWSYSDLDDSESYFVEINAPKAARGNMTIECGNVVYFNKSLTQCRYDGEYEDEIYYLIGPSDLNAALDVGQYDFTVKYTGDDHYSSSTHRNYVYFHSGDHYAPNDNVTITMYNQVYLDRNNDWEDYLARIEAPASATGNVIVLINGKKAFEREVATMFIHPSDLNVSLEYYDTYDVEVKYAGDGIHEETATSGSVKTTYHLHTYINNKIPYENSAQLNIRLPQNADGILTVTIEGKTYPVDYTCREIYFDVFTDNLTIGNHRLIVNYKDDSTYPEGEVVVNFTVEPRVVYYSPISSAEESFITVLVPEGTSGTLMIKGDGVDINTTLDGRTIIKIPKLTPSAYNKYFNVISTIDGQRYVGNAGTRVQVNAEGFSSNVSSSEIIIGDDVTLSITGVNTISKAYISVDENKYDINSTTNTLTETISGLTIGQHVIHIYVSRSGSNTVFYSNSFLITVKGYCNIAFDASGGEGEMANATALQGDNYTLPECNFTKEGMTFYGWNIVDYIIKKPGENITLTENITIKAIWLGDVQGKEAWIDYTTDDSVTGIIGNMELTDKSTGQIYSIVVFSDNETSQYSNATPLNTTIGDMISQFMPKFYTEAQGYAGNCTITIINETISDPQGIKLWDKRVYKTYSLGDPELDYMPIFNETGDIMATRFHYARGSYGKFWAFIITTTAEFESGITSISNAAVVLSKNAFTFNGNVQKPVINTIGGKALIEGTDYTIQWSNPSSKNAATYTVTIIGKGAYTGTTKATYTINKAANPLKIKGKTVKVKFQKLSKKTQNLKVSKVIKFTKKGQGTLTYAKKSGNKKITINKKTGKITIKKGLKKGTYKVKVKVKAKGNANYLASAFKTVTFKIKIK